MKELLLTPSTTTAGCVETSQGDESRLPVDRSVLLDHLKMRMMQKKETVVDLRSSNSPVSINGTDEDLVQNYRDLLRTTCANRRSRCSVSRHLCWGELELEDTDSSGKMGLWSALTQTDLEVDNTAQPSVNLRTTLPLPGAAEEVLPPGGPLLSSLPSQT